jgi:uncharacterized membrane protein YccC
MAGDGMRLRAALGELTGTLASLEERTADRLPDGNGSWPATGPGSGADGAAVPGPGPGSQPGPSGQAGQLISALDPAFRAQELGFAVSLIGQNIALAAAAERRSWTQRVLGRRPTGADGILSAAQARAAAHADPHSVWLRNSIRGAAGLGLAVLLARLTGVQHSFWVVLGTLSVLRSNALSTGQDALRALAGTVVGLAAGAGLLELLGTNQTALWFVLPVVVLLAGVAPAAISFAAGQAAFTLTLVILFNIIKPAGWQVGLFRLEDVALGCAVSLAVGLLFWPRGASSVLRQALADAYADGAAYLANAVEAGIDRCTAGPAGPRAPAGPAGPAGQAAAAVRASAAARRLDDAFRAYLAERGPKRIPLADVTSLITGASGLRLAADAVRHLWEHDPGRAAGERAAARREILAAAARVRAWYDGLANSLVSGQDLGDPLGYDQVADGRLIEAVRRDLHGGADEAATAVRIIWTGDHLDAARRLQATIGPAAHAALAARR